MNMCTAMKYYDRVQDKGSTHLYYEPMACPTLLMFRTQKEKP